mmetsp:Transcript_16934/g.40651  ORF Transcript_16934/g.40651 Transcript_16934/m.40651 type:complete len:736 (-) Transcript_16934:170-2377(-)
MKRDSRDEALSRVIADFWDLVFDNIPAWSGVKDLPEVAHATRSQHDGMKRRKLLQGDSPDAASTAPNQQQDRKPQGPAPGPVEAPAAASPHPAPSSPSAAPSDDSAAATQTGSDDNALCKCANSLVRICPSAFQDYSAWTKIYFALLNTVGKDKALPLFIEWSRAGEKFESSESINKLLASTVPQNGALDIRHLVACAKEDPALVLKQDWTPPAPGTARLDALLFVVDTNKTDPRYLVRIAKMLEPRTGMDKLEPILFRDSPSAAQRDALLTCWGHDADCPEYADAVGTYVFDSIFSYTAVRSWFEQKCFKIVEWGGKCFAYVKQDRELRQCTQHDLASMFSNLYYTGSDGGINGVAKKGFVARWLRDPAMKTFTKVECNPSRSKPTPSDTLNIWPGLRAETLPHVPEEEVETLVQPVIDHIRTVIVSGNEEQLNFVLAWLAQKVQFPDIKSCVAIIFQGEHGVGKDIILDFFRSRVLGPQVAHQADNVAEVLEKHSTALAGKIFVQIDEANGKDILPHFDRIKNKTTSNTLNVNPKNGHPYSLDFFADFVFTTNNPNPIPIDATDRRFAAFRCSSVKLGEKGYFDTLVAQLQDDRTARAFYQYLMAGDWSAYGCGTSMQNFRPLTSCYAELQRLNIPLWAKFLSHLCLLGSGCPTGSFSGTGLIQKFREWALDNNYEVKITANTLGGELKRFAEESHRSGVSKKRSGGVSTYTFQWDLLETYLRDKKLFDSEVF